ncbi:hypothetical protein, partial [Escherichia coli]|uniref:hypothetical protein n=1 Tax=Escherichia coli TaxID=562 RepID=UPI001CC3BE10
MPGPRTLPFQAILPFLFIPYQAPSHTLLSRPPLVTQESLFFLFPFDFPLFVLPPAFNLILYQTLLFIILMLNDLTFLIIYFFTLYSLFSFFF